jgi:predicted ABC-type sugar transport system permease subunit
VLIINYYKTESLLNTNKNLAVSVSKNPSKLFSLLAKNWALFFLLILILIFSFTGKRFFQLANFQNIIHLSTISLLLAAAICNHNAENACC